MAVLFTDLPDRLTDVCLKRFRNMPFGYALVTLERHLALVSMLKLMIPNSTLETEA